MFILQSIKEDRYLVEAYSLTTLDEYHSYCSLVMGPFTHTEHGYKNEHLTVETLKVYGTKWCKSEDRMSSTNGGANRIKRSL